MRGTTGLLNRRHILDRPGITLYVLLVCFLCWIAGYVVSLGYPVVENPAATPLWHTICRILPDKTYTYLIGCVLMMGGAFLLHRANYILVLIRDKTLLPFLLYILFLSTNPNFFPLKSTTVAVFCLILAIYLLFSAYHNPEATGLAYKTGLIIGMGSLFWIYTLWFVPLIWSGMYRFRTWNKQTFAASLMGLVTIYWFVLGWCVWQNNFTPFTIPFASLQDIQFLTLSSINLWEGISLFYIIILVLLASLNIITHEHEDNLRTRQFLYFLMFFVVWAFIPLFLYEPSAEEFLHIAIIPTSILIAHFFSARRNRYTFWLFHFTVIFFALLLALQLWNFL